MLGYREIIKNRNNGRLEPDSLKFNKIYPTSSGMIKDQTTPRNPEGLTLLAFLNKGYVEKFNNVTEEIKSLNRRFCPVKNIHATFLGKFPSDKMNEYPIKKKICEFFNEKIKNGYEIDFHLEFKHFRPGSSKLFDKKISDGTVVVIGDLESEGNKEFVDLAEELESHLKHELNSIFSTQFQRPFTTIWCTLGYFDYADFNVDKRFFNMFRKWSPLGSVSSFDILELQLVRHRFKSLDCYEPILRIPHDLNIEC